jgi:hypothetical protein
MPRLREPLVSGRDVAWLMTGHGTFADLTIRSKQVCLAARSGPVIRNV